MATALAPAKGGIFWSTVNGGASVVLPFLVFTIFTRMMSPVELSRVMLAVAMLEFLKAMGPQGIYDVLLGHDEDDARYYRTANAMFLAGGGAVALGYIGGVAFSPWFEGERLPLLVLAFKVIFDYALLQPQAVLVRRGAVRRLGTRGLTAGLTAGAISVLISLVATPIVGLACYYALQSLVVFLMTTFRSGALRMPVPDGSAAREMASQGMRASGVRLSAAVSNYLDQIIAGLMLAASQVGAYNLGKRLEIVSITVSTSFSQLLFQRAFVRAEPDQRIVQLARGMATITLVCGLPAILVAVFHRDAIPLFFGSQWASAAPTVALLACSGYVKAVGSVGGVLYAVTGRNGRLLALSTFGASTNILIILLFARFGVTCAAGALLVRNSLHSVLVVALSGDAKGHVMRLFAFNCIVPLAICAAIAWCVGQLASMVLSASPMLGVFLAMGLGGAAGAGAGFLLLRRRL